jgi:hypothetical protein
MAASQLARNQRDTADHFTRALKLLRPATKLLRPATVPARTMMLCRRDGDSTGDAVLPIRVGKVLYYSCFSTT